MYTRCGGGGPCEPPLQQPPTITNGLSSTSQAVPKQQNWVVGALPTAGPWEGSLANTHARAYLVGRCTEAVVVKGDIEPKSGGRGRLPRSRGFRGVGHSRQRHQATKWSRKQRLCAPRDLDATGAGGPWQDASLPHIHHIVCLSMACTTAATVQGVRDVPAECSLGLLC